jgi:Cu/Ag efflux protein CusF
VRFAGAVLGVTLLLAAPASAQSPAARAEWHGTGSVVALMPPPSTLDATRPVIIIHHQPIPGLMSEEMSMPFLAASTDLFRNLHPGDHISFTLKDVPGALLVTTIDRLPTAAPAAPRR